MLGTVTILVKRGTGSLARVAVGLNRKKYGLKSQEVAEAEADLERITLVLECPAGDADQVSEDIQSLDSDLTIEKIELQDKRTPTDTAVRSDKDLLEDIARAFPNIPGLVRTYATSLSDETRSDALFQLGTKMGRVIYKKDFALGSPLKMPSAWRRMVVPAVRKLGNTAADDETVTLLDCPFCSSDPEVPACCEFVTGFVQGLLDAGPYTKGTSVREARCRPEDGPDCTFAVEH